MNSKEIQAEIDRLHRELKNVLIEEQKEGREAYQKLKRNWEWRINQKSEHIFRIERKLDIESIILRSEFIEKYPAFPMMNDQSVDNWHGMDYVLIDDYILAPGGGHLILNIGQEFSYHEPYKLNKGEADAIRAGKVPERLMRK